MDGVGGVAGVAVGGIPPSLRWPILLGQTLDFWAKRVFWVKADSEVHVVLAADEVVAESRIVRKRQFAQSALDHRAHCEKDIPVRSTA